MTGKQHSCKEQENFQSPNNAVDAEAPDWSALTGPEAQQERESTMLDIDRMVNEGLAGGTVTPDNGMIGLTTTDTMKTVDETPGNTAKGE